MFSSTTDEDVAAVVAGERKGSRALAQVDHRLFREIIGEAGLIVDRDLWSPRDRGQPLDCGARSRRRSVGSGYGGVPRVWWARRCKASGKKFLNASRILILAVIMLTLHNGWRGTGA